MTEKEILQRLDILEKRVSKVEHSISPVKTKGAPASPVAKRVSLREFLISKNPGDDVKKILAIGYYLEKHELIASFNSVDLENALERAKTKKPKNINDKVNMNIRNGHMEQSSEKKDSHKAWYLTNSGESFVENSFATKKQ